ncbi:hypothetical protein BGW38_001448 [Lunasporangiospora selenospora]|uniref:Arrestin-like N-terminal domain-containing protein n=1 Tax=Lunasporangiospora selenospora TaxID=979761 RepID=A0A9P6FTY0_9FUNG|nr:hypothetical protein BGW38_001448 [Lunasporangiospora selenospora]
MRLFSKHSIHNVASYIAPQGFSVSLSHQHGRPQYYSPGSVIQGQVHLVLNSVITSPCTLRIIFACHQTIAPYPPTAAAASSTQYDTNQYPIDGHNHNHNHQSALKKSQPSSNSRGDNIFEVDHILVDNATLPPYKRQTPFHFSIKLPLCSYPPSFQDGDRSVTYSIQATLSFETQQGAPNTRSEVSSPAVEILYMPLVPAVASPLPAATAGPVASRRRSSLIIVEARAAAPREDRRKDRRKVKDSPKEDDTRTSSGLIEASIETKAGACLEAIHVWKGSEQADRGYLKRASAE